MFASMRASNDYLDYITTLPRVLFDYVPHQILGNDAGDKKFGFTGAAEIIQIYMDSSNKQIRMYGTAQELEENLNIYRNFPLKQKKFGFTAAGMQNTDPAPFYSIKGELFYCKQDYILHLHSHKFWNFKKVSSSELLDYLKDLKIRLDGCFEFIRGDNEILDRIHELLDLQPLMRPLPPNFECSITVGEPTLVAAPQLDPDSDLKVLKRLVETYPGIFQPYDGQNDTNNPFVVRIFDDGPQKFVMEAELFKSNVIRNVDGNSMKHDDKHWFLHTIDLNDVFKTFRNQLTNIEFIRSPITRAKHAAVPIVTPYGDHCILAADVLFELLRRSISALNIFQKIKNDSSIIQEYMSKLESKFPSDMKCRYFINLSVSDEWKKETGEFWKDYENVAAISVRDVRKNGFTVEGLKDELRYLGLTDVFPEIFDYAGDVYAEVYQKKKEEKLRTCDMFDALEKCQLICIFNRFPNLMKILHNQNACHRISHVQCEICLTITQKTLTESEKKSSLLDEKSDRNNEDNGKVRQEQTLVLDSEASITISGYVNRKKEDVTLLDASETLVNESGSCLKCLRINEEFNMVQDKMIMTQNQLKLAEDNAKINEKRLKDFEKIAVESQNEAKKMIKDMKIRMKDVEENASLCAEQVLEMEEAVKKGKESNKKLTDKNRTLEQEVNRLKQKNIDAKKQNGLKENITIKDKIIDELTKKNQGFEQQMTRLKQKAESDQMKIRTSFEKKIADNEGTNNEFIETNRKLGQSIVHLHQKIEKDQMESVKQQSRLEKEISENKRINIELQKSNACLSIQNDEHVKTIRTLTDRLAAVPSVPTDQVDSKKEDETPSGMRFQLVGFQKIKDSLRKRNPLKQAEDMVEELISLTNRPEIQRLGNYELMQFEGKFRNYSQTVEMNIQKLKDSGNCKDTSPLPEFPAFSERFMKEYWSEIEKQLSTSSEKPSVTSSETSSELADSECLICTDPMESTENTIKCETCKRRFHSTCASEWLKRKSVCPACSRGLLDPSEFPTLG